MKKLAITNVLFLFITFNVHAQPWTLQQCIDSAYTNSTKIKTANNNQKITALKQQEVKANLIPKLSIQGEYKYYLALPYQLMPLSIFGGPEGQFKEAQFGVPHNINVNALLQGPIYSNELMGNIEKLAIRNKMASIETAKSYEEIYFEVSTIYRNAQLLHSQLHFIDSILENTKKIQETVKQLALEKMANQSDIQKITLKIATLTLNKSHLETNLQQLYNALQLYTQSTNAITVEDHLLMVAINTYESKQNKDIALLKLQTELINLDLQTLKRSKYLPDVGFFATYGTQGYGYNQDPNSFLNFYPIGYVGLRVAYPIFNGNATNKKIGQDALWLENLKLKEEAVNDQMDLAIKNAVLTMNNAFQNVALNEAQMNLAATIYAQEVKKHEQGVTAVNDLLLAQNEWVQQQQNYVQSIAQFLAADLSLKKLTNNIPNNK
ncbi:TolC family protein [Putridiphycobacter roseus]|nr:TolC family protein [Putridiphycobacter roseus]